MPNSAIPKPIILKNRNNAPKPTTAEEVRKDVDWLKLHHHEYQGQWIALHKSVLLGANKSLLALHEDYHHNFTQSQDDISKGVPPLLFSSNGLTVL